MYCMGDILIKASNKHSKAITLVCHTYTARVLLIGQALSRYNMLLVSAMS